MSVSTFFSDLLGGLSSRESAPAASNEIGFPDVTSAPLDSRRLIRDRRYCRILSKSMDLDFDDTSITCAWKALDHEMAYVPNGDVELALPTVVDHGRGYGISDYAGDQVHVDSFHLDRDCITNADFAKFVRAGGYEQPQFWPPDTLPWVLQFVDRTGMTGPKFWTDGQPPENALAHPVTGICWYEANAYAQWAGKRLPTSAEWQRAGTWSNRQTGTGAEPRYPWGNSFDVSKANLWRSENGQLIAADALPEGSTPNGIRQLIGNVWEWVDGQYDPSLTEDHFHLQLDATLAEVRGGAFDTYFASQATCQFRTGLPLLTRAANVGFRCCVSTDDLRSPTTEILTEAPE